MFSLSMLWGLVNGIQILAYLMLLNIPMPGNVLLIDEILYEIATFDLVPLEFITDFLEKHSKHVDNNKPVYLSQ